ncbi:hypothetical protein M0804_001811 [Polistes exclamans]|nr:hypothetical protein M0804_001811 [Polistes exclamans]
MSYGDQPQYQTVSESPRSLAKKIESCIVRNAFDEECRAQKALNLLKARDRRIAYLEKRVIELEETAISMHAMSLRASSTLSNLVDLPNDKDAFYNISQSERTMKHCNDYKNSNTLNKDDRQAYIEQRKSLTNQTKVPNLILSSNTSCTDKEIFTTSSLNWTNRQNSNYFYVDNSNISTNVKLNEINDRTTKVIIRDDTVNENYLPEDKKSTLILTDVDKGSSKKNDVKFLGENKKENKHVVSNSRNYYTEFPIRVSSSVAWLRTKRNFRKKKIRPFVVRARRQQKDDHLPEKIDVSSFRDGSGGGGGGARSFDNTLSYRGKIVRDKEKKRDEEKRIRRTKISLKKMMENDGV